MKLQDLLSNITIVMFVPLVIAGSIAVMILSYLLVPLFIVGTVFFVLKTLHDIDKVNEK